MAQRSPISAIWRSDHSAGRSLALPRTLVPILLALAAAVFAPTGALAQEEPSEPPDAAPSPQTAPSAIPACKAASAILVDAATGSVLWEKNSRVRRPIASTTKIMTATLILESGRMDDVVTFSEAARLTPYANLNAKPGEQFRMSELLYAILLRSSNDACVAAAEHLCGSVARFAQLMTARAREIGCTDTSFVTVNGLYHPQHFSTAYDLAVMTRHAMEIPLFNAIVATQQKTMQRSINYKDVLLRNHNKFLERYEGADGVKTGYVRQSGKCLVASATRLENGNPWRLLTVVLNSGDTYGDSARMMDWGRRNFQPVFFVRRGEQVSVAAVHSGTEPAVPLVAANDLVAIIPRDSGKNINQEVHASRGIPAPVRQDQVGGKVVGMIDGRPVAEVNLVAARPVERVWLASLAPWTPLSVALVGIVLVPRYARTFTKSARRRRRRLQARRRELDRRG